MVALRYARTASGTHSSRIRADHAPDSATACWLGHDAGSAAGWFPNSCLHAVTVALTGFQLATSRSQPGRCVVGMNAFDRKVTGISTPNVAALTDSASRMIRPIRAPTHAIANPSSSSNPNPAMAGPKPRLIRQPIANPAHAITTQEK